LATDTKTCTKCERTLPLERFEPYPKGTYSKHCRYCQSASARVQRSSGYKAYLTNLLSKNRDCARKRENITEHLITVDHLVELWEKQEGRCAISGVVLTHHNDGRGHKEFNASIDRIDSQVGYIPGNVQLVALRVNTLKQTLTTDMLYWWVKTIYQHSCD
jgi:hypothetical protein